MGNRIESAVFGIDGNPIALKDAFSKGIYVFDARSRRIEETYYGLNGQLAIYKIKGHARATWSFDATGNRINFKAFDEKGELIKAL